MVGKSGYIPPRGRANRYYRKLYLDNYLYNQPGRGLGQHRLPEIPPVLQHHKHKEHFHPAVQLLLLLVLLVMCFICTVLCLLVLSLF